ncbi:unnamed protein product [Brassica oleracea]
MGRNVPPNKRGTKLRNPRCYLLLSAKQLRSKKVLKKVIYQSMAKRIGGAGKSSGGDSNILVRISNSEIVSQGRRAAGDAVGVSKKLIWSTGKAAWIAGTTFLILVVPLIIEMDREAQLNEINLQQASLLGAPASPVQRGM